MTVRVLCAAVLLVGCVQGCRVPDDELRRIVREELEGVPQREFFTPGIVIGPYSPAIRAGRFLFVSGQIALHPDSGQLVRGDIEMETRQVLDNLSRLLRATGYDSSHVVSATVYLKNMNDYTRVNAVYGGYFPDGRYPARVAVEVSNLPRQANVEIAVIAWK
jgi:2-iminobutanoate/2-iminopropanoate deaminase